MMRNMRISIEMNMMRNDENISHSGNTQNGVNELIDFHTRVKQKVESEERREREESRTDLNDEQ